jgi:hypothetical protein
LLNKQSKQNETFNPVEKCGAAATLDEDNFILKVASALPALLLAVQV